MTQTAKLSDPYVLGSKGEEKPVKVTPEEHSPFANVRGYGLLESHGVMVIATCRQAQWLAVVVD